MKISDHLKKLKDLYVITEEDWVMEIGISLTEPLAPTISIAPEDSNILRYVTWCNSDDDLEAAIVKAIDKVYREIILGEPIEVESSISNPDDRRWRAKLKRYAKRREALRLGKHPDDDEQPN